MPVQPWAVKLLGDFRTDDVTLASILDGLDDYFTVFSQMKKQDREAYRFFSKVGTPIALANNKVLRAVLDNVTIAQPDKLPSRFGVFFTDTQEGHRNTIIADKPSIGDYHYFTRLTHPATVVSPGTQVFQHQQIYVKRNVFTPEELRQYPAARHGFGMSYLIGISPLGEVRALPYKWRREQKLRNGKYIYHSEFKVPPGLKEMHVDGDADKYVRYMFNVAVAFTAAATSGITVTVRKNGVSGRIGVPITNLKEFFRDRDVETGTRKKPIIHLRAQHERIVGNRTVIVGDHLAGERMFSWRGYDIVIGAAGIHHPAVEGFTGDIFFLDRSQPDYMAAPPKDEILVPEEEAARRLQAIVWSPRHRPIRHGQPLSRYKESNL